MEKWIDIKHEPPKHRNLICYCPEWCQGGYQVAVWDGKKFKYDEQPNAAFSSLVIAWALLFEFD